MKTIKITLPAYNITLTRATDLTIITYDSIYEGKPRMFVYHVIGYFYEYTLTDNLLTLK